MDVSKVFKYAAVDLAVLTAAYVAFPPLVHAMHGGVEFLGEGIRGAIGLGAESAIGALSPA